MATSTPARRAPQDRKPKAEAVAGPDTAFEFTHAGKAYELSPAADVLTVGWARTHRHLTLVDQLFTILEAISDDAALAAIDSMSPPEFEQFQKDFYAHNGVSLGE